MVTKKNPKHSLITTLSGDVLENYLDASLNLLANGSAHIADLFTINPAIFSTLSSGKTHFLTTDIILQDTFIPTQLEVDRIGDNIHIRLNSNEKTSTELINEVETLQKMIDLVPHAIFLKDSKRRFLIINQQVAEHHNLKIEDMIGKSDEDFFATEDASKFIALEENLLEDKQPLHEEEMFTINDETKYMDSIKMPFYIRHKDEWGILGISMDITVRKRLLEEQTHLKLENQKKLMRAVVDTQERERKKIAQDIHDGVGQLLSAASMNLDAVISNASIKPEESLKTSNELVHQAIQEVRTLTKNLMPNVLKDFGLVEALKKLADIVKNIDGTDIVFNAHGIDIKLSEQIEINLYRIAQEIINNALKHAGASEISIQLFSRDNVLIIQIEDDGNGFDLHDVLKKHEGLGISSIQNRADLINADLDIDTQPGHGCSYSIVINLEDYD